MENNLITLPSNHAFEIQDQNIFELVEFFFSNEGPLASNKERYEMREGQVEMSLKVAKTLVTGHASLSKGIISLIEAGTGIGKSFAYLIPAIIFSIQNQKPVVVATNTINLQQQIIEKDVPFLQSLIANNLNVGLMKGRTNYLCIRKFLKKEMEIQSQYDIDKKRYLDELSSDVIDIGDINQFIQMQNIYYKNISNDTFDGSVKDFGLTASNQLWQEIQSESETTLYKKCTFYNLCRFYNSRKKVEQANIIIANHHLICADIKVRMEQTANYDIKAVLPPYEHIILDEAHQFEEAANNFFGYSLSRKGLIRHIHKLTSNKKGIITELDRFVSTTALSNNHIYVSHIGKIQNFLTFQLLKQIQELTTLSNEFYSEVHQVAIEKEKKRKRVEKLQGEQFIIRIKALEFKDLLVPIFENQGKKLIVSFDELIESLEYLANIINENFLKGKLEAKEIYKKDFDSLSECFFEIRSYLKKVKKPIDFIDDFVSNSCDPYEDEDVYWIDIQDGEKGDKVSLNKKPIHIGDILRENFFTKVNSATIASATLTTNQNFNFIKNQLGLDKLPETILEVEIVENDEDSEDKLKQLAKPFEVTELVVNSPFNYQENAVFAVPNDFAEPEFGKKDSQYEQDVTNFLTKLVTVTRGSTLLLFTNYFTLEKTYKYLDYYFKNEMNIMRQNKDEDRGDLLERFKSSPNSILLGTDSFWHGVDVPGDALRCVVIDKIPFTVPSDPLFEARCELMQRKERKNGFYELSIPIAIMKIKQAFGRLIRTSTDHGIVICLDSRLVSAGYKGQFLKSLPPAKQVIDSSETILKEVERIFNV